ncbi:hypothetical protein BGZ95_011487 [Linnemannia exigua]|uniref:FAD-binding domain-containing protein n=1 Tax=Linnemannia exigua TaxID=604196 RepID=A0AAD4H580_9FUNG|nr:hypothetical protein BGZ95_011487 [Linnemannia exigua]
MHERGKKVGTLPVMEMGVEDTEFNYGWFLEQERTCMLLRKMLEEEGEEEGVRVEFGWELVDTRVVEGGGGGGENVEEEESYVETVIRRALSGDNTNSEENLLLGGVDMYAEQEDKEYEIQTVRSKYLIACDGGRSTVRHRVNIGFSGRTLGHKTLMWDGECETDIVSSDITSITGSTNNTMIMIPLSNNLTRVSIEAGPLSPTESISETLKTVTVPYFEILAQQACYPSTFKVKSTTWLTCFKINERRADQFVYKNRIFLAGDAAHIHSPAGGQGLNTGFQDAHNLAWKLAFLGVRYQENTLNRPHPSQPVPAVDYQVGVRAQDGVISPIPQDEKDASSSTSSTLRLHQLFTGIARFHILIFTSTNVEQTLTPATVAHTMRFITQWRHKWIYKSSLNDGYVDKDLFKFHFLTPSSTTTTSTFANNKVIQELSNHQIGEGKIFVDNDGKVHKKYGFAPNGSDDVSAAGIVVLRPDSHIGYRVHGLEEQAWKDVDQYLSSILTAQVE